MVEGVGEDLESDITQDGVVELVRRHGSGQAALARAVLGGCLNFWQKKHGRDVTDENSSRFSHLMHLDTKR